MDNSKILTFKEFCDLHADKCTGLYYETVKITEPSVSIVNMNTFPQAATPRYELIKMTREEFFKDYYTQYLMKETEIGHTLYG